MRKRLRKKKAKTLMNKLFNLSVEYHKEVDKDKKADYDFMYNAEWPEEG